MRARTRVAPNPGAAQGNSEVETLEVGASCKDFARLGAALVARPSSPSTLNVPVQPTDTKCAETRQILRVSEGLLQLARLQGLPIAFVALEWTAPTKRLVNKTNKWKATDILRDNPLQAGHPQSVGVSIFRQSSFCLTHGEHSAKVRWMGPTPDKSTTYSLS